MNVSCAILAGGRSRRMGYDKATLSIGGKLLINFVYDQVKDVFEDLFVISSYHTGIEGIHVPIYKDVIPVQSPLAGIASALLHTKNSHVFILACDMPFTSKTALEHMIGAIHKADIVVPKLKSGFEALHAIYGKSCLSVTLNAIERGRLKISDIFPFVTVREMAEHPSFYNNGHSVFTNLNSEKDLSLLLSKDFPPEKHPYCKGPVRKNVRAA